MKMWSLNVMILLLFCYACLSTSKGKVFFVSKNFFNVLHWDSAEPQFPGQKLLYSVRYQKHGEEPKKAAHCQNITSLSCDLTAVTPPDYNVQYAAQVFVTVMDKSISLGTTKRFKPIAETTFGSPTLSIDTNASALFVNATPPLGPKNESIIDIITRSKTWGSRPVFLYSINVTHPEWGTHVHENISGQFVISLRSSQTQYCGFVDYRPSAEWGRRGSEKQPFCVTMPDKPRSFLHWILLGVAFLVALIIISAVSVCNYVKGGKPKNRPQALETFQKTHKVVQFPDRNLILSEVELHSQYEKTVYATIRMKPSVPSAGSEGYSPQEIPWQDSSSGSFEGTEAPNSNPNPFNTSAQSSEIYSSVAVHVPDEESEAREPSSSPLPSNGASWDNSRKPLSNGTPSLPDSESDPAGPIMLQTVRGSDGQLVLPSLSLQFQSSDGDPASPMSPERRPLLSDLIDSEDGPSLASLDMSDCSDSGCDVSTLNTPTHPYCNSNYLPSRPVTGYLQQGPQRTLSGDSTSELGYSPHWITAALHGTESTDDVSVDSSEYKKTNFPWNWTGYKKQQEVEEDEGSEEVEGSRQISLGGWVLQIQD